MMRADLATVMEPPTHSWQLVEPGVSCAVPGGQNGHHSGGTGRGDTQGQLLAEHQCRIGLRSHDTVANCQPSEVSVGLADNFSQQNVIY